MIVFYLFCPCGRLFVTFIVSNSQLQVYVLYTRIKIKQIHSANIIYNHQNCFVAMFEHRTRTSERWFPTRYESTKNQFKFVDRYITGLTREEASEYITNFPFIYYIYKKNTPNDQWKLLDELMKVPSESDGPGFIYGFMNQKENCLLEAPYWIKIGRTKQNPPQKRIFQWERDDQIEITEIFTVRTLYQKKLQALIHTLFAYARKNRVLNGKNRVEWFHFQQITLTAAAVNILNHIMNTIHTSKVENKPKQYMNRNLKQITEKVTESNDQINDILATSPTLVVESFVRDLGIQLGKNDEVKMKLRDCEDLKEMVRVVEDFAIGKQMKEFFQRVTEMEGIIGKYLDNIEAYRKQTFENVKLIYEKTKINFVHYDNHPTIKTNSKQRKPRQTKPKQNISKQRKPTPTPDKKKPAQKKPNNHNHLNHIPEIPHIPYKNNIEQTEKYIPTEHIEHRNTGEKDQLQAIEQKIIQMTLTASIQSYYGFSEDINQKVSRSPQRNSHEKMETVLVKVYNSQGKQQRIQQIAAKQFQSNPLKKYKQKSQHPKLNQQHENKFESHYQPQPNINQTTNQTFLQQKLAITQIHEPNKDKTTLIQFKLHKMSQVVGLYKQTEIGWNFIIYANQFLLDQTKLKLDYTYLIMSKKIVIDRSFSVIRSRKWKGSLNVFCSEIQGVEGLQIDEKCCKYVGFYQIDEFSDINPVDEYHKNRKIQQPIKGIVQRFQSLLKVN